MNNNTIFSFASIILLILIFVSPIEAQNVKILLQGDTQKIVNENPADYATTMENVLTDDKTKVADFILQMGDITEDSKTNNWERAQTAWRKLDGKMPYVLNMGNNDLMNDGDNKYNQYFPLDRYNKWLSFISNKDRHSNVAHLFKAGGADWLIISVRFEPSSSVKTWAEDLIKSNPNKNVIYIRHDANSDGSDVAMCKKYKNVAFVMCGHTPSRIELQKNNAATSLGWVKVCHHSKSRDDYFVILDINIDKGTADMRYYSPLKKRYGDDLTNVEGDYGKPVSWSGFKFIKSSAEDLSDKKNAAEFTWQEIPSKMVVGETKTVKVTMRNTGTTAWTQSSLHKLGSENPKDNKVFCSNRINLSPDDNINTGESKTFIFDITAPNTVGKFNFQWQMVQDNLEWFGSKSSNFEIDVVSGATIPAQTNWVGPTGNWSDGSKWDNNLAPGESSVVVFDVAGTECTINSSVNASQLKLGDGTTVGYVKLTVDNGGTLTTHAGWSGMAWQTGWESELVVKTGGVVNFVSHFWHGWNGTAYTRIQGGTINVGEMYGTAFEDGLAGVGEMYVESGTLNLAQIHPTKSIPDDSFIDITGGMVTIKIPAATETKPDPYTDLKAVVDAYIAAGKIISDKGNGIIEVTKSANETKLVLKSDQYATAIKQMHGTVNNMVYPNPSTGVINVVNPLHEEFTFAVYSVTGQLQYSGSGFGTTHVNLNNLRKGFYFVQVTAAGQHFIQKLLLKQNND